MFLALFIYVPHMESNVEFRLDVLGPAVAFLIFGTGVGAIGALLGYIGLDKRREGPLARWGVVLNLLIVSTAWLILLL